MNANRARIHWVAAIAMAALIGVAGGADPEHVYKAASFKPGGDTGLDFQGTSLMPKGYGHVTVSNRKGSVQITGYFQGLEPPSSFGPEYMTFVVWAVSPEGRISSVGEIPPKGPSASFKGAARLQTFGLFVTAEPHFAVREPSRVMVLENVFPAETNYSVVPIDKTSALIKPVDYKPAGFKAISTDPKVPPELYQAQNALRIAKWKKADTYAPDDWAKAQSHLKAAETALAEGESKKIIVAEARTAAQTAEDARMMAVIKAEAEALEAERKAAADKQLALEKQKAKAEADKAIAEAEAERQRAAVRALRTRIIEQLNTVLETKETSRGLVVSMADVLFDTDKANLKPEAREKLAKVSGLVMAATSLRLDVEGHTDSTGGEEHNQKLSFDRAESVRSYLGTMGVPDTQMSAKGLSSSVPVADNATKEGRQKNRRVEIIISGAAIGA